MTFATGIATGGFKGFRWRMRESN